MIITIDGPAGSGKSTAARLLAEKLGFELLRTGLMYRAVALAGLREGVDWAVPEQLEAVMEDIQWKKRLRLDGARIFLDGVDVSQEVETLEVTAVTKYSASNPFIRARLTEMQREYAASRNCITEGRDQGTAAFPNADLKFYLDATPEERARRRFEQKKRLGELPVDADEATEKREFDEILRGIQQRDWEDSTREVAPLKKADDAIYLLTDGLSIEQVVQRMFDQWNGRCTNA